MLHELGTAPLVVLVTDRPPTASAGAPALTHLSGPGRPIFGILDVLTPAAPRALYELRQVRRKGPAD